MNQEPRKGHWPGCWKEHYACAMELIFLMGRAMEFMNHYRPAMSEVTTDGAAMGWGTVDGIFDRLEASKEVKHEA